MNSPKRQLGVSVITLIPWSYGPGGFGRALRLAKRAGFDGLQVLPLRGWGLLGYPKYWDNGVISWEDAWNTGSFWEVPLRHLGRRPDGPLFLDWVLFPNKKAPVLGATYVAHYLDSFGVVEVHPELSLDPEWYAQQAFNGFRFCIDTHHLTRPHRVIGDKLDWENILLALPTKSVELIHLNLRDSNALEEFKNDTGRVSRICSWIEVRYPYVPIILEVPPLALHPKKLVEELVKLRKLMEKI